VAFIYRNDPANDAFGFDIRSSKDLRVIKFSLEENEEWIDVGGFNGWTSYNFPCLKVMEDRVESELDMKSEMVLICPKKTIVLEKKLTGQYRLIKNAKFDKMQVFDRDRKLIEDSLDINYRIIEGNFITEKRYYTVECPFMDKLKTVSILNDVDSRRIKLIEQVIDEGNFTYDLKKLDDTFKTEDATRFEQTSGINKLIAQEHPATDC